MVIEVDFLIIGSGLAGLTFGLNVAPHGSVAVLTKQTESDANSSWAQGGIAGALADDDSFDLHKQDTLIAGAGLCNEEAVDTLVSEGPERIRDLIRLGASFSTERDESGQEVLALGREGGHSRNRIVHTADFTGWECERTLLEAVRDRPEIVVHEHYFVTDLIIEEFEGVRYCVGARAMHRPSGAEALFLSKSTLLATGGCGQVYQHTTNPPVATGDGVAISWRAGCTVANMEFIQFHPTTLYHPGARCFLITEALRGDGGVLRNTDGEAFMAQYHPLRELAPRDIVARAIMSEMRRSKSKCVFLDVTHINTTSLRSHFPTVYEKCLSVGIDITTQPIPVVPGQHYQCGGVVTDLHGSTGIPGLYAAGEVACTGVHGANRLASNSLLEAMVFGYRAAAHAVDTGLHGPNRNQVSQAGVALANTHPSYKPFSTDSPGQRETIQKLMRQSVGIVRSTQELQLALSRVEGIIEALETTHPSIVETYETRNIAQVAWIIIRSALARHESRGLHYTVSYPNSSESERHDTVLSPTPAMTPA